MSYIVDTEVVLAHRMYYVGIDDGQLCAIGGR